MTDPEERAPDGADRAASSGDDSGAPRRALPDTAVPSSGPPWVLMLAAAAFLALGAGVVISNLSPESADDATPAGGADDAPAAATGPPVHLTLFAEHDGEAVELPEGVQLTVGDTVMFELSADKPADVRVWVEVPGMLPQELGTFPATADAAMLSTDDDDGFLAWTIGNEGTAIFKASSTPSGCPDGACDSFVVSVVPAGG